MTLTPYDIQARRFNRRVRGYDETEVEAFLEEVASEVGSFQETNRSLEKKLEEQQKLVRDYKKREASIKEVLEESKAVAERLRQEASREANLIVKEAELKAADLIAAGQREADEVRASIGDLQRVKEILAARLKNTISVLQDLLEQEGEEEFPVELIQSPNSRKRGKKKEDGESQS